MPVVYIAKNSLENDKCYIGSSMKSLEYRKKKHKLDLYKVDNGYSYCKKFYDAIIIFGFNNFVWEVLEEYEDITKKDLELEEGKYQLIYNSVNNGYNCVYAGNVNEEGRKIKQKKYKNSRRQDKAYCSLCDCYFNYDGWGGKKGHLNSKIHKIKTGEIEDKGLKYKGKEKEYFKNRYEEKKDKLLEKVKCECNLLVAKMGMKRHLKTAKHKKQMKLKDDENAYKCDKCGMITLDKYAMKKHKAKCN